MHPLVRIDLRAVSRCSRMRAMSSSSCSSLMSVITFSTASSLGITESTARTYSFGLSRYIVSNASRPLGIGLFFETGSLQCANKSSKTRAASLLRAPLGLPVLPPGRNWPLVFRNTVISMRSAYQNGVLICSIA